MPGNMSMDPGEGVAPGARHMLELRGASNERRRIARELEAILHESRVNGSQDVILQQRINEFILKLAIS